jgi:hypothetical protein
VKDPKKTPKQIGDPNKYTAANASPDGGQNTVAYPGGTASVKPKSPVIIYTIARSKIPKTNLMGLSLNINEFRLFFEYREQMHIFKITKKCGFVLARTAL